MHMTIPLYYDDPYKQTAEATVLALEQRNGKNVVILDRTICYPEGGGQPGDRGMINGTAIVDTVTDGSGQLVHVLGAQPDFGIGETVQIKLDWAYRYDYMQQHTAQHLLSGILHSLLGIGTVSVHLGTDDLSIELDTEVFSDEDVEAVEDAVNAAVRASVSVSDFVTTQEEVADLGLRRPVKVDTDVRIVRIGAYDTIACGGVHVENSAELLYVSYLRSERIRGRLKTYWIAGDRAIARIRAMRQIVDETGTLLSVPPQEIPQGVLSLQRQLADARHLAHQTALRITSLKLDQAIGNADRHDQVPSVVLDVSDWEEDEFKALPEALLSKETIRLCTVRGREDGKLAWLIALKDGSDASALFQTIRHDVLPTIEGRGGGKPPLWQGVGTHPEMKQVFLKQVETLFKGYGDGQTR